MDDVVEGEVESIHAMLNKLLDIAIREKWAFADQEACHEALGDLARIHHIVRFQQRLVAAYQRRDIERGKE